MVFSFDNGLPDLCRFDNASPDDGSIILDDLRSTRGDAEPDVAFARFRSLLFARSASTDCNGCDVDDAPSPASPTSNRSWGTPVLLASGGGEAPAEVLFALTAPGKELDLSLIHI